MHISHSSCHDLCKLQPAESALSSVQQLQQSSCRSKSGCHECDSVWLPCIGLQSWLFVQFWKENVEKFEEKDFQILRVLLKLLEASRETRTLAVGCHDLGKFIINHPHGRSIVTGMSCNLA